MSKLSINYILLLFLTSCNLFENNEKKAIEVCQSAKVQMQSDNALANLLLNTYGLGTNATWLDYANMIAKREPNKKYDWHANKTDDNKFYIVDFTDVDGWGHRWEVDVEQKIVKSINQNEYLSRKYGLSRFAGNDEFEVSEIQLSELKIDKEYSYWNGSSSSVVFVLKASVLNKTEKSFTSASIDGKLKIIFKDKTVVGEGNYDSGFKSRISKNNPWQPNTTRDFYIKTKGIEKIYLSYIPEYVIFDVSLEAEDPIGYTFDKDIAEYNLKEMWKNYKEKQDNPAEEKQTQKTPKEVPTYKEYSGHPSEFSDDDTTSNSE